MCHQGQAPNGLAAADFFQRHPPLHAFLLAELTAAVAHLGTATADEARGSAEAEASGGREGANGASGAHTATAVPPSLLPALALLSRLRCVCFVSAFGRKSPLDQPRQLCSGGFCKMSMPDWWWSEKAGA